MSWDPVWEEVFRSQAWGKYPGEELIRFVARNFYRAPDRAAIKLLELGCGPGANLWFCAREGFTTYGIDGSATAIKQSLDRLNAEVPDWHGEVRVGDFCALPYGDDFFDALIDNEAVYCNDFDTSRAIYAEAARVLKPGGKLFVRTFATGTVGDGTGESLGHHAWHVTEGPLLGKGFARFTSESDIVDLLTPALQINSVDLLSWTVGGQAQTVREWIIIAEKQGAA
jgi:SAM-dependent methyltransferase